MSLRWRWAGEICFVVMRNFIPAQPWLIFDLKGATAHRRALSTHPRTRFTHSHTLSTNSNALSTHLGGSTEDPGTNLDFRTTLRDWEWMDTAMVVDIAPEEKEMLMGMVCSDADFLASNGLIDYSLLVAICRPPRGLSVAERNERLKQLSEAGGYVSLDKQTVYFFGIIDVLERYSLGWRVQHVLLTAGYFLTCRCMRSDGISALAPDEYADRFKTFIAQEVLRVASSFMSNLRVGRGGIARWGHLWERRAHGLLMERIQVERADRVAERAESSLHISKLEAMLGFPS